MIVNFELVNLIMDLVILMALAATIAYAVKLSRNLQAFRNNRDAFMNLIADLSQQIEHAQTAVNRLNDASEKSGRQLQNLINEAKGLSAGLESANKDNGRGRTQTEFTPAASSGLIDRTASFFIQDKDFGRFDDPVDEDDLEDDEETSMLSSKAEKQLYKALRKNRKAAGQGHA